MEADAQKWKSQTFSELDMGSQAKIRFGNRRWSEKGGEDGMNEDEIRGTGGALRCRAPARHGMMRCKRRRSGAQGTREEYAASEEEGEEEASF